MNGEETQRGKAVPQERGKNLRGLKRFSTIAVQKKASLRRPAFSPFNRMVGVRNYFGFSTLGGRGFRSPRSGRSGRSERSG